MKNGNEFLLADTVGFIQKLPTMLVAAFTATLEEISELLLLVQLVDLGHPLAEQQIEAVDKVLLELDVSSIPRLMVWSKDTVVWVEALIQFDRGEFLSTVYQVGVVEKTEEPLIKFDTVLDGKK
ncbi:hypothetical protein SDJN03_01900, partial [Cucurbita argyrosperma subsp. sororia]